MMTEFSILDELSLKERKKKDKKKLMKCYSPHILCMYYSILDEVILL